MEVTGIKFSPESLQVLNACLAFITFGIALDLQVADFIRLKERPKAAFTGVVSQFLLLPALTFLFILVYKPEPALAMGMILVAACPGGNISNFISHLAKANTALSISLTAISSFLAVFMTPFNFAFWSSMLPESMQMSGAFQLEFMDIFSTVVLILALPLILGMLLRHYQPKITAKILKPIKVLSMIIFTGFIVMAFISNREPFLEYFHLVLLLVLIHNGLAFLSGFLFAKVMRLPLADVKTVTIETGIQNSGLGLVLIFGFFGGNGGMALVAAWWGVWHILAGLGLATFWKRHT